MTTFYNLTNGIEAIETIISSMPHFVRIQSTWCEQHRWNDILLDLDYTFLMSCRTEKRLCVIDYSQKKKQPRALYQGIAFIQYVLNRFWYDITDQPVYVRGADCKNYFAEVYDSLDKRVFNKLKYFQMFEGTGFVNIITRAERTIHDGDKDFYKEKVKSWNFLRS